MVKIEVRIEIPGKLFRLCALFVISVTADVLTYSNEKIGTSKSSD